MNLGGKARALKKLQSAGFRVPALVVCDTTWSQERILAAVDGLSPEAEYFAVRSSAAVEDSKAKSYAGHFYTAIGVSRGRISEEVIKVRDSYAGVPGAVIIQEFIPSESGGVLFTNAGGRAVINAIEGLCFPVVGGESCDEYVCARDGNIESTAVPEGKQSAFFRDGSIVREERSTQALTEAQIREVVETGMRIEAYFGHPQDIEWCFKEGKLYILQARPITRGFDTLEQTYFDSANIAESYSGIVLPLTCSFARMVYETVYKDLLVMSGISRQKVEEHTEIFENLLGFFYGRMYYNMNNWYRMAEFAPGYRRNKQNFERMITSNVRQDLAKRIRPSVLFTAVYPWIILAKVLMFGHVCRDFSKKVKRHLRELRTMDFNALSYAECISLFASFNKNLLRRWYVTVENDFFVMTYLGLLGKLMSEEEMQKAITFPSKATQQVHALGAISREMAADEGVWRAVEAEDVPKFEREVLKRPELRKMLDEYMHEFGGRFANELKLESVGVDEDQTRLLALLKAYRTYVPKRMQTDAKAPQRLRARIVLAAFKKHAGRREEFRLLRSNTFSMARRLFKRMGVILAAEGVIKDADDVFYLTLEEILNPAAMKMDWIGLISERKRAYAQYQDVRPPAHFSTQDGNPPPVEDSGAGVAGGGMLKGRPASSGIALGRVRVFKEFHMPDRIDFDILVTAHTDPGWTSLIALSKGLIIEHGGVLSHASIVARELGIPAVIGVANATRTLVDAQEVEVNGSTGSIRLL